MKEGNDEEFLRLVSDKKFNLNQYDTLKIFELFEGIRRTPLQEACYLENPYYVEKLLENGADPNYPKLKGNDRMLLPLAVAVRYMGVESGKRKEDTALIIEMLLEHGADKHAKDKYGKTAYDYAVYYGREELYDLLKP